MPQPNDPTVLDALSAQKCIPHLELRIPSEEADALAARFKALSHPVRVQMLDLICQGGGDLCGCDIERHFDLTQPTISHHLHILRDAGLIVSESRSTWVHHHISEGAVGELQRTIASLAADEP